MDPVFTDKQFYYPEYDPSNCPKADRKSHPLPPYGLRWVVSINKVACNNYAAPKMEMIRLITWV